MDHLVICNYFQVVICKYARRLYGSMIRVTWAQFPIWLSETRINHLLTIKTIDYILHAEFITKRESYT